MVYTSVRRFRTVLGMKVGAWVLVSDSTGSARKLRFEHSSCRGFYSIFSP